MRRKSRDLTGRSSGTPMLFHVGPDGRWAEHPCAVGDNRFMYTWGFLVAKALGQRDPRYGINAFYLEFENVASPSDTVSVPSFNLQDDRTYYDGLASSPTRDYVRAALDINPLIDIAPGYEAYFPPGQGNRVTIVGQTYGDAGVHMKAFDSTFNSKVCGVALVAAPVWGDLTQDVLFSRYYWPTMQQQIVGVTGQFGLRYPIIFG